MTNNENQLETLIQEIESNAKDKNRYLISISGAPGCGKSTFSAFLKNRLKNAEIIQMDGFHLENTILNYKKIIERKGSPETFDFDGLESLIKRVKTQISDYVYAPLFNRELDSSIGSAIEISKEIKYILVEGNYLLLDEKPWSDLNTLFDYKIFLYVDEEKTIKRLTERWLKLGLDRNKISKKVFENDMKNFKKVSENLLKYDFIIKGEIEINE